MRMKLGIIFFLSFLSALRAVSLSDLKVMPPEEKIAFFRQDEGKELDRADDFIPALIIGIKSGHPEVQQVTLGVTSQTLAAVQQLKSQGHESPFALTAIPELRDALSQSLQDEDPKIRGASVFPLLYSDSNNQRIESLLMDAFDAETNQQVKASILQNLVEVGYDSERIKEALLRSIVQEDRHLIESAAKGIAILKPEGGLSLLAGHLNPENRYYLSSIVLAIGSYGSEATPYLEALNKLINDPSIGGSLTSALQKAELMIMEPDRFPENQTKSLISLQSDESSTRQSSSAEEVAEVTEEVTEPEPATEEPAEVVVAEASEESAEQSSNWWLWLIGLLVFVGGLAVVVRRKN